MQQPAYHAYLEGSGLEASESIAGREEWDRQIRRLYNDARAAMIDLGIIEQN